MENKNYEVIIIGGSYAGLSAAMALGRSLRRVLIIDSGLPCNRQTPHSHNFITQDGVAPSEISRIAKEQVLHYDMVSFLKDLVISAQSISDGFSLTTQSGDSWIAKKLIFATGIKDLIPDVRGYKECWGISMIHCPYCHGYEFKGKKTGIMANGDRAFHLATLVNNLSAHLSILTTGKANFSPDQLKKLKSHNISIFESEISAIEHDKGYIQNVIFQSGEEQTFDAIYAGFPFIQNTDAPVSLGCDLTEQGYIKINEFQKTTVEGVYACGDNASMMRSVASSVAAGNLAGAMANAELSKENF